MNDPRRLSITTQTRSTRPLQRGPANEVTYQTGGCRRPPYATVSNLRLAEVVAPFVESAGHVRGGVGPPREVLGGVGPPRDESFSFPVALESDFLSDFLSLLFLSAMIIASTWVELCFQVLITLWYY